MFSYLRTLIPKQAKQAVRHSAWQLARPTWKLASGLVVPILDESQWYLYNEIFVDCVYDQSILMALTSREEIQRFVVLDLGANVGMFTLRVAHLAGIQRIQQWCVTAVEGNPDTARELSARVFDLNQLGDSVRVINGLVGKRSGIGVIAKLDDLSLNDRVVEGSDTEGASVAYIDLESILPPGPIDLLKCDIEGSELLFLEEYGDFLRRVRVAVFELHGKMCDSERCQALLQKAGFNCQTVIVQEPGLATIQFWKGGEVLRK